MKNVLSPFNMAVFAIAVGILVANLYYAQPLLAEIALDLGVNTGQSGILVTLSQLGYALGVFFIVPLGDRTDRRNLISYMLILCAMALLGAATSPTLLTLSIASLVSGITSSATMVIIPYVAAHSDEHTRGKSVGQVMTGLLLGILLARTISGAISEFLSWRWMYYIAGRLGDAGHAQTMTGLFSLLLVIPWIILIDAKSSLILLCVGIFFVDVAVQGLQVTHQSVLYRLGGNIRSRITSIFITSGFIGMSIGSALASTTYVYMGWNGICITGGIMAFILAVSWLLKRQINAKDI